MNYKNKDNFHLYPMYIIMVVFGIGMGTGLIIQVSSSTATADATTQSLYDINVTMTNNTAFADPVSQVTAMTAAFGEPFYVLNDSKDTGNEVVNLEPPQTKGSYIAQGYMQGIGNVSERGTYVTTYSSPIISSVGKGLIFKNDHVATFTAQDTGRSDNEGNRLLKGTMLFQSDDMEMAGINGKVGFYLYWKDNNGNDWTKMWLLE
jgi:hypothetical protein